MENSDQPKKPSILHKLPINSLSGVKNNIPLLVGAIIVVLGGVLTGWRLSGASAQGNVGAPKVQVNELEAGISDTSKFPDTAIGILREGPVDGDGTHHLEREGGKTQQVALASTVIDLDSFIGKKVQVWGQSLTAQKAYWLMDVGKLKVVQ